MQLCDPMTSHTQSSAAPVGLKQDNKTLITILHASEYKFLTEIMVYIYQIGLGLFPLLGENSTSTRMYFTIYCTVAKIFLPSVYLCENALLLSPSYVHRKAEHSPILAKIWY